MRNAHATIENARRSGVTLVEVLMSLMIMSIGIAGVATLFPVAALRSAQATKLTNAAMVKRNAEAIVHTNPGLIFDPDGDLDFAATTNEERIAVAEHFASVGFRNYIVDPNGYMAHAEAGLATVDPAISDDPTALEFCNWFGNQGLASPYTNAGGLRGLRRFDGGLQARTSGLSTASDEEKRAMRLLASSFTGLGDGWHVVINEEVGSASLATTGAAGSASGITLDGEVDLTEMKSSTDSAPRGAGGALLIRDPELLRVTLFSLDGRSSQVYPVTRIDGQTVYWTEDAEDLNFNGVIDNLRPLPSEFGGEISRAVIEVKRTNDFNWFLTVRRGSDGAARGIDVCVTFNNGVEPEDEWVYPVNTDIDNDGTMEGGFSAGSFTVEMTFADTAPDPSVRKGGFILDVHNGRWYRVVDYRTIAGVDTSGAASSTLTTVQMQLETEIVETSPAGSGIMLLPTLVDVYPLGGLNLPSDYEQVTFR